MPCIAEMVRVRRLLHDAEDVRIIVHPFHVAVPVKRPKKAAERHLRLGRQFLVAKKNHIVREEGFVDFSIGLLIDIRQIDTGNFRPQCPRQRLHGDPAVFIHYLHCR